MDLSPSGERANLRLWLEHVAGAGRGQKRPRRRRTGFSAVPVSFGCAASSSQISLSTPAAPRRNAELSTLPVTTLDARHAASARGDQRLAA